MNGYSEGLYKENLQLRQDNRALMRLVVVLITKLGGRVVVDQEDLFDEDLNEKSVSESIDVSDLSRIYEVK